MSIPRTPVPLKYRPYAAGDGFGCIALAREMHAASKYAHIEFSDDRAWNLLYHITKGHTLGWVAATDSDDVVGFLCAHKVEYFFADHSMLEELAFYVKPEYRSLSVAKSLLHMAEQWCIEHGTHSLILSVSAAQNIDRVGKLYEHCGYTHWSNGYRKEFV